MIQVGFISIFYFFFKVGYSNLIGIVRVSFRVFVGFIEKDMDVCIGRVVVVILNLLRECLFENGVKIMDGKVQIQREGKF